MAASKINYANLRSAQRKNKSMHEVKDLLTKNPYSNFAIHTNQSPPFALEQNIKLQKEDLISRGKPVHSLFDDISRTDKFDHHKQPPSKTNNHHTAGKGHHSRTKSSITEMYQKNVDKQDYHGRDPDDPGFSRAETSTNKHSIMKHNFSHAKRANEHLISNFDEEHRLREDMNDGNYNQEAGYRRPSLVKEGTALDDFLHKNRGFGNGPTSPEEKLYRKTPIGSYEHTASPGDKKKMIKISVEKSANNDTIEEIISPKGDFLSKIDNYIGYFKKSEVTQRKMSKGVVEYFTEDEETYNEDGVQDAEMKIIKKHVEGLNSKVRRVLKTNQKLVKEFGDMLAREGEYTQRLGGLEDEFVLLKNVNRKYRDRLKETTHLLEKERMDNQSNLLALKKVLSKGINMALENKIRRYMDHHKDLGHKRKDDRQERDEWKDRKSTDKRQSQRRDESSYVQKASMYSNDELIYNDKRTERGNRDDDEEENIDTRELEEAERYNHSVENRLNDKRDEDWRAHYQHKNKEPSRDQQIRALQEKLSHLMDDQGPNAKYSHQHEKLMNQVWPRAIAPGVMNMKQSKTKYSDKHSVEINDQHHGYGSVNREKHGHRPKMNSFFIKQE